MEPGRIENSIVSFHKNRKTRVPWLKDVHENLEKLREGKRLGNKRVQSGWRIWPKKTKEDNKDVLIRRETESESKNEYWWKRKELRKMKVVG